MDATTQAREDAVNMVEEVLRDAGRSDRYLRKADDGHYFTTPDLTFLTDDGPLTPPYVKIPVANVHRDDDDVMAGWAESLLEELDGLTS